VGTVSSATVYQALLTAGFTPSAAKTMVAIAHAESGLNPTILGDISLENATWGPSYGLFQVRTLKAEQGTGSVRDQNWLSQSIANQAKAAYSISNHGGNFGPWSTYTHGSYRQFLSSPISGTVTDSASPLDKAVGGAKAAAGTIAGAVNQNITDPLTSAVGGALAAIGTPVRNTLFTALFVVGGILVLGLGLYSITRPVAERAAEAVKPPKLLKELG
jgi:hypothetical protein